MDTKRIFTEEEIRAKAWELRRASEREAQRKYAKRYQKEHRKELNAKHREYMRNHPEKAKLYRERYWNKKALEVLTGGVTDNANSDRITGTSTPEEQKAHTTKHGGV